MGEVVVGSEIQKVCKTMCFTTLSSCTDVIVWVVGLMLFNGLRANFPSATCMVFHSLSPMYSMSSSPNECCVSGNT